MTLVFEATVHDVERREGDMQRWPLVEVTMWEENELGERHLVGLKVVDIDAAERASEKLGTAPDDRVLLEIEDGTVRYVDGNRTMVWTFLEKGDPRRT